MTDIIAEKGPLETNLVTGGLGGWEVDPDPPTLLHDGTNELPLGSDDGVVEPTRNRDNEVHHRGLEGGGGE